MSEEKIRKNAAWSFDAKTSVLIVDLPSGKFWQVNLSEAFDCFKEMDEREKKIFQYGIRQYLSDDTAASKENKFSDDDKMRIFNQSLKDMIDGTYWKRSGKATEKISKYKTEVDVKAAAEAVGVSFEIAKKLLESQGFVIV